MKRRQSRSTDRPHRRFHSWLVAAPSGDPPRELAVHAASCPECQRIVAVMDDLASVDLGLAGLPEAPAASGRYAWLIVTRRAAMAGAALAAFAAVAFIGWRFFLAPDAPLLAADFFSSPAQAIQGGAFSPQPSAGAVGSPVPGSPAADPTDGPATSAAPSPAIGPPVPGQTALPSIQPTGGPVANAPPGTTPQPTSVANPSAPATQPPTPPPTPRATPRPPPPTPEPTPPPPPPPTPEATPGGPLPECADLQDNDGDGFIDLLDLDCLDVFDLSESS